MTEPDGPNELEPYEKLASIASPASPGAPHLTDAVLARLRGDDEAQELASAYAHVASCAACRARMIEPKASADAALAAADAAVDAAGAPEKREANVHPLTRYGWVLAAAAVVALAVGVARLRGPGEPLAVTQHALVGMMGDEDAEVPLVAPEDRNIEISVKASGVEAARLIVADRAGKVLAPIGALKPDPSGAFHIVVAPRTFGAHEPPAVGWIVAGSLPAVTATFEALRLPLTTLGDNPDAPDARLRVAADRAGARVGRTEIGTAR